MEELYGDLLKIQAKWTFGTDARKWTILSHEMQINPKLYVSNFNKLNEPSKSDFNFNLVLIIVCDKIRRSTGKVLKLAVDLFLTSELS